MHRVQSVMREQSRASSLVASASLLVRLALLLSYANPGMLEEMEEELMRSCSLMKENMEKTLSVMIPELLCCSVVGILSWIPGWFGFVTNFYITPKVHALYVEEEEQSRGLGIIDALSSCMDSVVEVLSRYFFKKPTDAPDPQLHQTLIQFIRSNSQKYALKIVKPVTNSDFWQTVVELQGTSSLQFEPWKLDGSENPLQLPGRLNFDLQM
ncbi:hypothetical protein ACP4OV_004246 [Aristida adscensionis]